MAAPVRRLQGRRTADSRTPIGEVVAVALTGDPRAWDELVNRYERLVWKAVNMVADDNQDREDAFNGTWLRLAESLASVRDPDRLGGWLAVTATREAIAVARSRRAIPLGSEDMATLGEARVVGAAQSDRQPGDGLLDGEAEAARAAFRQLDDVCRELLTLLILHDPPLTYREVEQTLGRPHGWIGPTRLRCLDKLRATPEMVELAARFDGSWP